MNYYGNEKFKANYERIVSSSYVSPIVRKTVIKIQNNNYMTIGDFFKGLSDEDFNVLVDSCNKIDTEISSGETLLLLTIILSEAEGLQCDDLDQQIENLNAFIHFIACVNLEKKGIVKVYYENLSFGEDMKDSMIVEILPR